MKWIYGSHLHILLFTCVTDEKVSKPGLLGGTSVYEELRNSVLHTGRDLGVHDVEGQRILQVTVTFVTMFSYCPEILCLRFE